jgi:hypothetical protein
MPTHPNNCATSCLVQSGAVLAHARVILGSGAVWGRDHDSRVLQVRWRTECVIEGARRGDGFTLRAFLFLPYSSVLLIFEKAVASTRSKTRVGY